MLGPQERNEKVLALMENQEITDNWAKDVCIVDAVDFQTLDCIFEEQYRAKGDRNYFLKWLGSQDMEDIEVVSPKLKWDPQAKPKDPFIYPESPTLWKLESERYSL